MSLLLGRTVCITGSSRGIGRATAVECAKHGASGLILHYFGDESTTKEVETLQSEIHEKYPSILIVTVPGDIADPDTSALVCDAFAKFELHLTVPP